MLLTPGFNPGHKKVINRFGVISEACPELVEGKPKIMTKHTKV